MLLFVVGVYSVLRLVLCSLCVVRCVLFSLRCALLVVCRFGVYCLSYVVGVSPFVVCVILFSAVRLKTSLCCVLAVVSLVLCIVRVGFVFFFVVVSCLFISVFFSFPPRCLCWLFVVSCL